MTFNGAVTVGKIEAFASTAIYNGEVTSSNQFVTVGNVGRAVFNGNYHWATSTMGEMGINGGNSDITFTSLSSDFDPFGVNLINLFDNATLRNGANLVYDGETALWSRRGTSILDLQGFDETFEFLGSDIPGSGNSPDPNVPVNMGIDFGVTPGANSLTWVASHNMGGTYPITNFEIGTDTLELSAAGTQFFTDDLLAKITINGIPYSPTDPGTGNPYWSRDSQNIPFHPQFFNVDPVDLVGDYNGNGEVDAADYVLWRNGGPLENELADPGTVSPGDYEVWRARFGNTGTGREPPSVPLCRSRLRI